MIWFSQWANVFLCILRFTGIFLCILNPPMSKANLGKKPSIFNLTLTVFCPGCLCRLHCMKEEVQISWQERKCLASSPWVTTREMRRRRPCDSSSLKVSCLHSGGGSGAPHVHWRSPSDVHSEKSGPRTLIPKDSNVDFCILLPFTFALLNGFAYWSKHFRIRNVRRAKNTFLWKHLVPNTALLAD
jgi:hypothetical protein